jgi:hypothetical protein
MHKFFFFSLFLCFGTLSVEAQKVFTSPEVEATAKWAKVPYKKTVKKATKGDRKAIADLVVLFGALEKKESIMHGRTCLELMNHLGDSVFSKSLFLDIDRKYWPVLMQYLPSGQAQVSEQRLRVQPLDHLFPVSYGVMQGDLDKYQTMHCSTCGGKEADKKAKLHENDPKRKNNYELAPGLAQPEDSKEHTEKDKSSSEAKQTDGKIDPDQKKEEIDPILLKHAPKKSDRPIPKDVEEKIDAIIKAQGGGN